MNSEAEQQDNRKKRPRSTTRRPFRSVKGQERLPVPLPKEEKDALEDRADQDSTNQSAFVADLVSLVLLSPGADKLREIAEVEDRVLLEVLRNCLNDFLSRVDVQEVNRLAELSNRGFFQMVLHLLQVGITNYKKSNELS